MSHARVVMSPLDSIFRKRPSISPSDSASHYRASDAWREKMTNFLANLFSLLRAGVNKGVMRKGCRVSVAWREKMSLHWGLGCVLARRLVRPKNIDHEHVVGRAQNYFGHDQNRDFKRVFIILQTIILNLFIYPRNNDENILTFKTVYFISFNFKIICLLSLPSLTRTQPTEPRLKSGPTSK